MEFRTFKTRDNRMAEKPKITLDEWYAEIEKLRDDPKNVHSNEWTDGQYQCIKNARENANPIKWKILIK